MELVRRIKKLIEISIIYWKYPDTAVYRIIDLNAKEYIDLFRSIGVDSTEELEDLRFHIRSYLEIPAFVEASYCKKDFNFEIYLEEVEKQRAVERDFICELLKSVPFGFNI